MFAAVKAEAARPEAGIYPSLSTSNYAQSSDDYVTISTSAAPVYVLPVCSVGTVRGSFALQMLVGHSSSIRQTVLSARKWALRQCRTRAGHFLRCHGRMF